MMRSSSAPARLVAAATKEILGASLLGTECDEVIHSVLDVMYAESAIYRDPVRDAQPPDCHGIDTDHAWELQPLQ